MLYHVGQALEVRVAFHERVEFLLCRLNTSEAVVEGWQSEVVFG